MAPPWSKTWSFCKFIDYREAATFADPYITQTTTILCDGRSEDPIYFYFHHRAPIIKNWPYLCKDNINDLLQFDRIIFVVTDFRLEFRKKFDLFLRRLEQRYSYKKGYVDYPFFEYIFERKDVKDYLVDTDTRQINQPVNIYGLEFEDLHLPAAIKVNDKKINIAGVFYLPDINGNLEISIPLDIEISAKGLTLLSNFISSVNIKPGQLLAMLCIETSNGQRLTFPLRLGKEIHDWNLLKAAAPSDSVVFTWRKHFAFVGHAAYQDAWRDFPAGIYLSNFRFDKAQKIKKLSIRYVADKGTLYIWGLFYKN